jgi:hypothetical protein
MFAFASMERNPGRASHPGECCVNATVAVVFTPESSELTYGRVFAGREFEGEGSGSSPGALIEAALFNG